MSSSHPPSPSTVPTPTLYTLLRPITVSASDPRARFINWGLSYECTPLSVFEPENEYQCELVLELARREGKTVRAAGVGHSPSDLACTTEFMLRTEKLDRIIEVSKRPRFPSKIFSLSFCLSLRSASRYGIAVLGISEATIAASVVEKPLVRSLVCPSGT